MTTYLPPLSCAALTLTLAAAAQDIPAAPSGEIELDPVVVVGEAAARAIPAPFPPEVEGARIFSGKRASVIDLTVLPKVQAGNYRQALALTPGLIYAEETTPLVSLGYRGIGDPHRSQFLQVLKDGIPIHADPFGYPEAYYTPPLDSVERIEFIRGGGALMYGAQPAGALNYITRQPRTGDPFAFRSENTFGSDGLFSSWTSVDGTQGGLGFLGEYNHRESEGFRSANSDYVLDGGTGKLAYQIDAATRALVTLDLYTEEHGEPGGLTAAQYAADRNQATKQHDRFRLRRNAVSLEVQHTSRPGTEWNLKTWTGYYDRWSRRQIGAAEASNIEYQEFETFGIEPRLRHDWEAWGERHTLAAGVQFYTLDSPRTDKRGAAADASEGAVRRTASREVDYASVFAENKFTFGRFSVTPGVRVERIDQDLTTTNFSAPLGTFEKENSVLQPLFGVGMNYDTGNESSLYANVSQSYRGTVFSESIIPAPGATIQDDIDPAMSWSYEIGWRGTPESWLTFDTSLFCVDLDNRFGVINNVLTSVGRSLNYGVDGAVQADLTGAWDEARGTSLSRTFGSLSLYANISLLEAELHGGPNDGGTPQYAPDYLIRAGLFWKSGDRAKVSLLGTFMDDHNAQDSGNPAFAIPAWTTWDLTAEVKVTSHFTVMAGINNLFDGDYYARVRSDGIDPAAGRNFYLGGAVSF